MPKILKAVLIAFLFTACITHHENTFAWQYPSTAAQQVDEAAEQDSLFDEETDADVETYENEDVEAPPEAYNEYNFDKADNLPVAHRRNMDDAQWKTLTSDPAFQYEEEKEQPAPRQNTGTNWWMKAILSIFTFFASATGKGVIILVVVLLVLFLIAKVFQVNGRLFFAKKDKKFGIDEEVEAEDYIPDNWEKEIADAAKAGNYRLALRYCYRYLLLNLQEKELIKYQVAKTNYQYVYELAGTALHKPFMKLTRDYEYAWYGGFDINKEFYETYHQMTQDIQKQLKKQ